MLTYDCFDCPTSGFQETYWTRRAGPCVCELCGRALVFRGVERDDTGELGDVLELGIVTELAAPSVAASQLEFGYA